MIMEKAGEEERREKKKTLRSCNNDVSFRVSEGEDESGFVMRMRSVKVREGDVDAAQPHLGGERRKIKDDSYFHRNRCVCLR